MKIALIGTVSEKIILFRRDFIKLLISEGHQVYAFATDFTPETKHKVSALGATPVDYSISRAGLNPLSDIKNTFKLAGLLKEIRPDVSFTYFTKPVIFGTLAAVLAGIKRRIGMLEGLGFTFTEHPNGEKFKTKLVRLAQVFLYYISFYFLERVIFLNPDDPNDLISHYRIKTRKVSVLGGIGLNFADYPYSSAPIKPIRFIFVGRLLAEKGVHEYAAAAKIVKKKYPDIEFIMLGGLDTENPGGLTLEALNDLTSNSTINHPGHVDNVHEWIANSSVFVLPSYREGVPRSTQEAMAIGRAVITTDVPGCRETVVHGLNGFLVPKWNSTALAEKMIYLIENPTLIASMGIESHRIAKEKFDAAKVNKKLMGYILGSY